MKWKYSMDLKAHALNFTFRITLPLACDSSAQHLLNAKQLNFEPFCIYFAPILFHCWTKASKLQAYVLE